jgi:hypothetical protein
MNRGNRRNVRAIQPTRALHPVLNAADDLETCELRARCVQRPLKRPRRGSAEDVAMKISGRMLLE